MSTETITPERRENGSAPERAPDLPVDTFKEAAPFLRRPFTPEAVKFKVQSVFPKGDPKTALVVAYIDARLVVDRLNQVCPHLWFDEYAEPNGGTLMCRLTVDGIVRRDIGSGYQGKGLYSDALKRAGVKFGIGVSLYAIPKQFLTGANVEQKSKGSDKSLVLTNRGEAQCRKAYAEWLKNEGIAAFGEPLDHGDSADSVGELADVDEPTDPVAAAEETKLSPERAKKLEQIVATAGLSEHLTAKLRGFGAKALTELSEQQAIKVYEWASDVADSTIGEEPSDG